MWVRYYHESKAGGGAVVEEGLPLLEQEVKLDLIVSVLHQNEGGIVSVHCGAWSLYNWHGILSLLSNY